MNTFGKYVSDLLDVATADKTFSEVAVEFVQTKLDSLKPENIALLEPYVVAIAQSIVGFVMMFVTLVVFNIFKFILYIIYLIFFKEGRKRKKMRRALAEGTSDKQYKRRRLLGGLVGAVRGTVIALFTLGIFGTLFYAATGGVHEEISDEKITITIDGKEHDLTDYYKLIDAYANTGIMNLLESGKGMPLYSSIINMFAEGKLEVSEDSINTKIYPFEEIGVIAGAGHKIIRLVSDYNLDIKSSTLLDDITLIVNSEEDFSDRLVEIIKSMGKTNLQKALGKTINLHMATIVQNQGIDNKYFNQIFLGENAITLGDLASSQDVDTFVSIMKCALNLYFSYNETKDAVKLVVDKSEQICTLVDLLLELSIFKNNPKSVQLNNIISDLLTEAVVSIEQLAGLDLSGISWINAQGSSASASYEIANFMNAFKNFMKCGILEYDEEGKSLTYNLSKIDNLWEKDSTSNMSAMDYISQSEALRRVASVSLVNIEISGIKIYVPQSACDEGSNIIKASEYSKLFSCLGELITRMDLPEGKIELDTMMETLIPNVIDVFKDSSVIDVVFDSLVLEGIVAKVIYDKLSETEYITTWVSILSLDDENIEQNINNWVGPNGEIRCFLKGATSVLEKEVVWYEDGKIQYDLSKLSLITIEDENGKMPIESLCGSLLLRSIIPNALTTLLDGITIYIPNEAYDSDYAGQNVISSQELRAVFKTLGMLLEEIDIDSDTLSDDILEIVLEIIKDETKCNKLLGSSILEATIAIQLHDLLKDNELTSSAITSDYDLSENYDNMSNWVGENGELKRIINAINVVMSTGLLEIDLSGDTTVTYDLTKISELFDGTNEEPIDKILKSALLHGAISNILKDIDLGYEMYIPSSVLDNNNNIEAAELKRALKSAELLIGSLDLDSEDLDTKMLDKVKDLINDQNNIDVLLKSIIIEGTLVHIIWDNISDNTIIASTIPSYLSDIENNADNFANWVDTTEADRTLISSGELRKILKSLTMIDIDNMEDINFIFDLTKSQIVDLMASDIIAYLITDKIENISTSSLTIHVLAECYEEVRAVITADEIYQLIASIKYLIGYDETSDDPVDIENISFEISEILSGDVLDEILKSLIIEASMSFEVYNILGNGVTIPNDLMLSDEQNIYNWITVNNQKGELRNLIDSLSIFGIIDSIDTSSDFELSITSIIDNIIGDSTDYDTKLEHNDAISEKIIDALKSRIIWISMSKELVDSDIKVSNNALDNPDANYIIKDEIAKLFIAIKELGMSDFVDINISLILDNSVDMNTVLESDIIWYAISDAIINNGNVQISTFAYDSVISTDKDYIKVNEIKNLISALNELGITEINGFASDDILEKDMDILLESFIVWYLISDTLASNANISIPDLAYADDEYLSNIENITIPSTEKYIIKEEIKALINAIKILGDFENFDSDVIFSDSFDIDDLEEILRSYIIWYTFSDAIINNGSIQISSFAYDLEVSSNKDYIKTDEIISLIEAIKELGTNGISSVDTSQILSKDISVLLKSYIIWYTISDTIINNGIYSMPDLAYANATYLNNIEDITIPSTEEYITREEIANLINAMNTLNIDFGSFDSNIIFNSGLSDDDMNDVLESYIIWYAISDALIANDSIEIPDYAYASDEYIKKEEIQNLISALNVLGCTDIGALQIDSSDLFNYDSEQIRTLLASFTIRYKISGILLTTSVRILDESMETYLGQDYIVAEDIVELVVALKALRLSSFDNIVVDPSELTEEEITSISTSIIMRSTISKMILEDNSTKTLVEAIEDRTDGHAIFTEVELHDLLLGIKALGVTDAATIASIQANVLVNKEDSEIESMLNSYTLWYIFGNQLSNYSTAEKETVSVVEASSQEISTQDIEIATKAYIKILF